MNPCKHPSYPDTVIFQSLDKAIDRANELINQQGCVSYSEMADPESHHGIDYDKLFKDPDFTDDIGKSVFVKGDVPTHKEVVLLPKLRRIRWYRPPQIAPNAKLIGFTSSDAVTRKQTLQEAKELKKEELINGLRIFKGEDLENKWFLNALSMVSSEPLQFARVNELA